MEREIRTLERGGGEKGEDRGRVERSKGGREKEREIEN